MTFFIGNSFKGKRLLNFIIFIMLFIYGFSVFVNTTFGVYKGVNNYFCLSKRKGNAVNKFQNGNVARVLDKTDTQFWLYPSSRESGEGQTCFFDTAYWNRTLSRNSSRNFYPWQEGEINHWNFGFDLKIEGGYIEGSCSCGMRNGKSFAPVFLIIDKTGFSYEIENDKKDINNTLNCYLTHYLEECEIKREIENRFYLFYIIVVSIILLMSVLVLVESLNPYICVIFKTFSYLAGIDNHFNLCNPLTKSFVFFRKEENITNFSKGLKPFCDSIDFFRNENVSVWFNSDESKVYWSENGVVEFLVVNELKMLKEYLYWISIDHKNCVTDGKNHFFTMKEALTKINEGNQFLIVKSKKVFSLYTKTGYIVGAEIIKKLCRFKDETIVMLAKHNELFFKKFTLLPLQLCLNDKMSYKDRPCLVKNKQWKVYTSDFATLTKGRCWQKFKPSEALKFVCSDEFKKEREKYKEEREKIDLKGKGKIDISDLKVGEINLFGADPGFFVVPLIKNDCVNSGVSSSGKGIMEKEKKMEEERNLRDGKLLNVVATKFEHLIKDSESSLFREEKIEGIKKDLFNVNMGTNSGKVKAAELKTYAECLKNLEVKVDEIDTDDDISDIENVKKCGTKLMNYTNGSLKKIVKLIDERKDLADNFFEMSQRSRSMFLNSLVRGWESYVDYSLEGRDKYRYLIEEVLRKNIDGIDNECVDYYRNTGCDKEKLKSLKEKIEIHEKRKSFKSKLKKTLLERRKGFEIVLNNYYSSLEVKEEDSDTESDCLKVVKLNHVDLLNKTLCLEEIEKAGKEGRKSILKGIEKQKTICKKIKKNFKSSIKVMERAEKAKMNRGIDVVQKNKHFLRGRTVRVYRESCSIDPLFDIEKLGKMCSELLNNGLIYFLKNGRDKFYGLTKVCIKNLYTYLKTVKQTKLDIKEKDFKRIMKIDSEELNDTP